MQISIESGCLYQTRNDAIYAAFDHPWIIASYILAGTRITPAPGEYVCGIYARSDSMHGVHKALANEMVPGVPDLKYDIDDGIQAVLNQRGVNVIRRFPGRGVRCQSTR